MFTGYPWYPRGKVVKVGVRDRPRFFDQAGHQTTSANIGNKHFFTKSCHRQTYQNYEQPPQRLQKSCILGPTIFEIQQPN